MTHDTWHVTHDRWREVDIILKCHLPSSYSLGVKVFWRYFHKRMIQLINQSMSDEGVCKIARLHLVWWIFDGPLSSTYIKKDRNRKKGRKKEKMSCGTCQVSCVTCQGSHVMCCMSPVNGHLSLTPIATQQTVSLANSPIRHSRLVRKDPKTQKNAYL